LDTDKQQLTHGSVLHNVDVKIDAFRRKQDFSRPCIVCDCADREEQTRKTRNVFQMLRQLLDRLAICPRHGTPCNRVAGLSSLSTGAGELDGRPGPVHGRTQPIPSLLNCKRSAFTAALSIRCITPTWFWRASLGRDSRSKELFLFRRAFPLIRTIR